MHETVTVADLYPVMEETLRIGGCITLTASGMSMLPMLRNQRDAVILGPATEQLHLYDVVLYRRENGQFVLHRIVGLESNGDYILCGDNQFVLEHHIKRTQVVCRLQAFIRKGRRISCASLWYKAYIRLLPALRLIRFGLSAGGRYKRAVKRHISRLTGGSG